MDALVSTLTPTRTKVRFFGVASGAGARDQGCREGPAAVRASVLGERLAASGFEAAWQEVAVPSPRAGLSARDEVVQVCGALMPLVRDSVRQKECPVIIGGDHSCAIGTWSGVAQALRPDGPLGLVWIDAHMDSHVPETSPSGAYHGMPLAALMGYGDPRLTAITEHGGVLDPANLSIVGVRSYEPEEAALLEKLGVRVYFMEDIARLGLRRVLEAAVGAVSGRTAGIGVSIDLDAVDPSDAPGVGSPVPGGLRADDLLAALSTARRRSDFTALEVVEYNPSCDVDQRTKKLITRLITTVFGTERIR